MAGVTKAWKTESGEKFHALQVSGIDLVCLASVTPTLILEADDLEVE